MKEKISYETIKKNKTLEQYTKGSHKLKNGGKNDRENK